MCALTEQPVIRLEPAQIQRGRGDIRDAIAIGNAAVAGRIHNQEGGRCRRGRIYGHGQAGRWGAHVPGHVHGVQRVGVGTVCQRPRLLELTGGGVIPADFVATPKQPIIVLPEAGEVQRRGSDIRDAVGIRDTAVAGRVKGRGIRRSRGDRINRYTQAGGWPATFPATSTVYSVYTYEPSGKGPASVN